MSAFQQTLTHQHGALGYASLLSATPTQSQYNVPQLNALSDYPSPGSGHETPVEQHRTLTYPPLWFFIPWQSLYQFLQPYAFEYPSSGSEHETPGNQHDSPIYALSWSLVPEQSLYRFLQCCVLTGNPSGSGHETPIEQHAMPTYPPSSSWFRIPAHSLYQFLRTEDPLSDSGYEAPADQHYSPIYAHSWFHVPAQSLYQFLQYCVLTGDLSSCSEYETFSDQRSTPAFAPSQPAMSEQSQYQDHHLDVLADHPSFTSGDETTETSEDGSVSNSLPRSVTPTPSEDLDAQPNEPTPSIPSLCPICGKRFSGARERNRHLKSYLPHSIYCPFKDCPWTGRRRCDLTTHWGKKHSKTGQVLGSEKYKIYEPKAFVKSILDGSSHVEVACRSAYEKVQERLLELGKVDAGANVLGRKLDIEDVDVMSINSESSRLSPG
ncbi:hypothetical protein DFH94DRAFT_807149 [Russula ochroleuca]|jgi:hypothetical protein|uniref:C2H2-type domain-containing protein n=1 Tax=Russula ochroleuca TaxID=152965 RepID=A0A9P5K0X0_9AGAM|nr:hypothetical protein DFH94DRAFT_807149 [Russula ochroleuca]